MPKLAWPGGLLLIVKPSKSMVTSCCVTTMPVWPAGTTRLPVSLYRPGRLSVAGRYAAGVHLRLVDQDFAVHGEGRGGRQQQ